MRALGKKRGSTPYRAILDLRFRVMIPNGLN